MIAATGSFDAGPVDGYLADLAGALGRTVDEQHHRELLARLSARDARHPYQAGTVTLTCADKRLGLAL